MNRSCRGPRPSLGFTLVEVMVALAIFAVLATTAYAGLEMMLRHRQALADTADTLRERAFALHALERDLRQVVARPVRDEFGATLPALLGAPERIELTIAGPRQPPGDPSSRLIRVVWFRDGEQLQRGRWRVLDRAPGSAFVAQPRLDEVTRLSLAYLDSEGRWRDRWPPADAGAQSDPAAPIQYVLPRAIELRIETRDGAEQRRLVALPVAS